MIRNEYRMMMLVLLTFTGILYGAEFPSVSVCEVAQQWANEYNWGKIDQGLAYYGPDQTITAWVFTVYRKPGTFPTSDEIMMGVINFHENRLRAENNLKICIDNNDRQGIFQETQNIENSWKAMRNAEAFATIMVTEKPDPHVAMAYPGLPPNYVSLLDAKEKAFKSLGSTTVEQGRFYFIDVNNIYAEFKTTDKSVFINIILLDRDILWSLNDWKNEIICKKSSGLEKTMATVEKIISGVPAYNSYPPVDSIPAQSCRQVSSAMVLGYWDDRGYTNLIDGGGSSFLGTWSIGGWEHLVHELSVVMGYGSGADSLIYKGIVAVCNNSAYSNNYEFKSKYKLYIGTIPDSMAQDWNDYCIEIENGRPFVYCIHGTATPPPLSHQTVDHAVAAIGYKKTGDLPTQHWRIVHYNSGLVGDACYLCEHDMHMSYTDITTIIPGGGHWSGNYDKSTIWSGNVSIDGDVSVANVATLIIMPASTVTFSSSDNQGSGIDLSKCELIVNGTLKADSTRFTGLTKGCWYGIRFTSSGTNNSYLKRKCTIKNAFIAVSIDSKNPYINNCFIDDARKYGVYISGSSAQPTIQGNYIEADTACIAHFNGGNGAIVQNSLRNARYGVWVISGSPSYGYYNVGRNKFESSIFQDRVRVDAGLPDFSQYQYVSQPYPTRYSIRNLTASTIQATYDYWEVTPPPSSFFYGSVNRSNPLSSPPSNPAAGPTWSLPKALADEFFVELNRAVAAFYEGKYSESRIKFKELAEKYWTSEYSSYALNWYMLATEQIEDIGGQVDYLNSIKKDKSAHENTRFYALKWLLQCELRKGTAAKAIKLAAEMDGGTLYDREISLDLAMGLFAYQKNKKAAEDVLDKLSLKFTDDNTSEVISKIKSQLVESVIPGEPAVPIQQDQEANSTLSAFPNPFNATARISYRLANAGRISIVIYNILGQQVLKLVDKDLEVGNHEVVWDGKDKYGTMVPSGMYLCRLETMDKGKTIKLLMTK